MKPNWTERLAGGWAWLVLALLNLPILVVVVLSFNEGRVLSFPPRGLSLHWYEAYFASARWKLATLNSFKVATATVLIGVPIGVLASFALVRGDFPGRKLVLTLVSAPLLLPGIIVAIALYFFFARLGMIGTFPAMALAHIAITVPIVVISVNASLSTVDENLELAAAGLGANRWQVFWHVSRPLMQPGILTGAAFAFLMSFDELPIALFISGTLGETLPARMWSSLKDELDPIIAVVSTLLIVVTVALSLAGFYVQQRRGSGIR
ncbi:ABC transporter permease [Terrarubrum flagellatum]|uniref:ABC transporter permease n=1 Tax=Terrirubrum flagellatum TaxID=2895980 RepID=UPI00314512E7